MSGPCPVRVRVTVVGAPGPVDVTARVGTIFYPFNEDGGAGLSDDQPLPLVTVVCRLAPPIRNGEIAL